MVERVNVGADVNPDAADQQAAHDASMAAKADQGVSSISSVNKQFGESVNMAAKPAEAATKERPADIPEKFWDSDKGEVNVAALLKAQQDAEKALRQKQVEKKPEEKQEESQAPEVEQGQQSAVDAAAAEWAEKGELSDATFEALEKVGLSRDVVNTYIEGQQAIVEKLQNAAYSEFDGTQDTYQKAIQWAANSLSDEEIEALDLQLTSTNPAIVRQGAKTLAARYNAEADITPSVNLQGDGNTATGSYFRSSHEMTKAMSDPRYAKDESFRNEVAMKIERAIKAGVKLYG